jgi:beta-lactamase class A
MRHLDLLEGTPKIYRGAHRCNAPAYRFAGRARAWPRGKQHKEGDPVRCISIVMAALLAGCAPATSPSASTGPAPATADRPARIADPVDTELGALFRSLSERIAREAEGEVAVGVIDMESGRYLGIGDRVEMHAASTMKVPILLELYRQADLGRLRIDQSVPVSTTFRSIANGAEFTYGAAEATRFGGVGTPVTLDSLARPMITRSSNLATNILIEIVTADSIAATLARIPPAGGMRVLRGVQDDEAFRQGLNNTTTAEGYAHVLAAIARCDILLESSCRRAQDVLLAQEIRSMIPAGLPAGTRVGNKTGNITGIRHDGGIIYRQDGSSYVLVVLTRGMATDEAARQVIRDVSALTWAALGDDGSMRARPATAARELLRLHERHRVAGLGTYMLHHAQLWPALDGVLAGARGFTVEEIGESAEARALRLIRYGSGPTRVLLWSQMHGDETTASRTLADLLNYIAMNPTDPRVTRWQERLELLLIPMLNPDGAERHTRRNAFGIDVNRDARVLATPEGRALKAVHDRFRPQFGFNLHDQNPRTRVGASERRAGISLLAPLPDARGTPTPELVRAQRLAAVMGRALEPVVGGFITRYDDSFNPRAFGDLVQSWGTSAVLVESGGWARESTKHFLRTANFITLVTALDAIAAGNLDEADDAWYHALPQNGRALNDLLLSGGRIVLPGHPAYRADIVMDQELPGGPLRIVEIGDLGTTVARDTLALADLFIHFDAPAAADLPLPIGASPPFTVRRGAEPDAAIVWRYQGGALRQERAGVLR